MRSQDDAHAADAREARALISSPRNRVTAAITAITTTESMVSVPFVQWNDACPVAVVARGEVTCGPR